ncbi:hypothetical protein GOP47_0014506 [Adiantum capillus-veneris]|uniref:SB domain-containing protein n=1 Tax=Adiantum capillus-veneris TaxID=13818 RepID=A0A9D4ZC80_ADICA|nr:hypothetical protein GOP47_0014506 [Adiantum capillus-veneris]
MSQTPPSTSGMQPTTSMNPVHGAGAFSPSTSIPQIPSTSPYDMRKGKEMEMDKLANTQGLLRQREQICKKGLQELSHEKEALEQQLQTVLTNTDVLETWLKDNKKNDTDVDIDNAFEPCDALSKQLLECTSAELAIEDVLYSLDKAVQEGVIPVDIYLKQIAAGGKVFPNAWRIRNALSTESRCFLCADFSAFSFRQMLR